jgi:hypothetical protein
MAEIRSRFFQRFDPTTAENEKFTRDLKRLFDLSPASLDRLFGRLPALLSVRTVEEEKSLIRELTEQVPESERDIRGAVESLAFFANRLIISDIADDSPEILVSDLRAFRLIDQQQEEVLTRTLRRLKEEILPSYRFEKHKTVTSRGLFPSFSGLGATVELRAVQAKRFRPPDDVQSYEPEFQGAVGVASISIVTDDERQPQLLFQVDAVTLQYLIDGLRAVQKDIEAFENMYGTPATHA